MFTAIKKKHLKAESRGRAEIQTFFEHLEGLGDGDNSV